MTALSPAGAMVRRHDPDRFLCSLFAPAAQREALFLLYAFNHELARAWEVASQPALALIRCQWWREVVEGDPRPHELATPLHAALAAGMLARADLLRLIEGREGEADLSTDLTAWQGYVLATAGELAVVAGRLLGAGPDSVARLRDLGAAFGAAGVRHGAGPARRRWGQTGVDLAALTDWGRRLAATPRPMPRRWIAAGLVGVLARRDLRREIVIQPRGVADRAAVTWAALRGVA